jgi:hypothetical protein
MDDLIHRAAWLEKHLNQLSGNSIRAQLLVGRLQLQEASIDTLGRDLTDIRQPLTGRSTVLARLREEAHRIEERPIGTISGVEVGGMFVLRP